MISRKFFRIIFLLFILLYFYSLSFAGGFQLWEQDASGIGDNHAGSGAQANNAGIEYYNPAGMSHLDHFVMSGGLAYIPLDTNYEGTVGQFASTIVQARSQTKNFVPNFHLIYPATKALAFGFGLTVPFGLMTFYPIDSRVAVAATKTKLETVNFNPSISYAPNKYFSIGAGFDVVYGEAVYDSINPVFPSSQVALNNYLSDWTYGWNAGVLINFTPKTRVGVSYRGQVNLQGKGSSFDEANESTNTSLTGAIKLPATWNFSFYSHMLPRFAVLFTTYYTQWSSFDDLLLKNVQVNGQAITVGIHENYQNTVAYAGGVHVWLMKNLMLKLGVGYDQTPTQDGLRDIRLPDTDRWSLAVGLQWRVISSVKLDVGWMHFVSSTTQVDDSHSQLPLSAFADLFSMLTQTIGVSHTSADVIGFQLSYTPRAI